MTDRISHSWGRRQDKDRITPEQAYRAGAGYQRAILFLPGCFSYVISEYDLATECGGRVITSKIRLAKENGEYLYSQTDTEMWLLDQYKDTAASYLVREREDDVLRMVSAIRPDRVDFLTAGLRRSSLLADPEKSGPGEERTLTLR